MHNFSRHYPFSSDFDLSLLMPHSFPVTCFVSIKQLCTNIQEGLRVNLDHVKLFNYLVFFCQFYLLHIIPSVIELGSSKWNSRNDNKFQLESAAEFLQGVSGNC